MATFPKSKKSCLIVKYFMVGRAGSLFQDLGVNIVTSCRFLGGVIGDQDRVHLFILIKFRIGHILQKSCPQ